MIGSVTVPDYKEYFLLSSAGYMFKREWSQLSGSLAFIGTEVHRLNVSSVGQVRNKWTLPNGQKAAMVHAFRVQFTDEPSASIWFTVLGLRHMEALIKESQKKSGPVSSQCQDTQQLPEPANCMCVISPVAYAASAAAVVTAAAAAAAAAAASSRTIHQHTSSGYPPSVFMNPNSDGGSSSSGGGCSSVECNNGCGDDDNNNGNSNEVEKGRKRTCRGKQAVKATRAKKKEDEKKKKTKTTTMKKRPNTLVSSPSASP